MSEQPTKKSVPDTDDIDELARFFDTVDSTEIEGFEEIHERPVQDLVNVSLRLPRNDLEVLKRIAAAEGLPPTTFMRWLLRRFVRSKALREFRAQQEQEAQRKAG